MPKFLQTSLEPQAINAGGVINGEFLERHGKTSFSSQVVLANQGPFLGETEDMKCPLDYS